VEAVKEMKVHTKVA